MNYLEGLVRARRIDFSMGHGYDMYMAWIWTGQWDIESWRMKWMVLGSNTVVNLK